MRRVQSSLRGDSIEGVQYSMIPPEDSIINLIFQRQPSCSEENVLKIEENFGTVRIAGPWEN